MFDIYSIPTWRFTLEKLKKKKKTPLSKKKNFLKLNAFEIIKESDTFSILDDSKDTKRRGTRI